MPNIYFVLHLSFVEILIRYKNENSDINCFIYGSKGDENFINCNKKGFKNNIFIMISQLNFIAHNQVIKFYFFILNFNNKILKIYTII